MMMITNRIWPQPQRRGRPSASPAFVVAITLLLPSFVFADRPGGGDFRNLLQLGGASRFTIHVAGPREGISAPVVAPPGTRIGEGQVHALEADRLDLQFAITRAGVQGRLKLRVTRREAQRIALALEFRGRVAGRDEYVRETVYADADLAGSGILSFNYNQQRYFFQLSRNSRGENRLVTNWGSGQLRAVNGTAD